MPNFNFRPANAWSSSILALFLVSCSLPALAQVYPVDTLMNNGRRANRINLVFLSDGYQAAQLETYVTDATKINNALFAETPLKNYRNYFNAFAIRVPSDESGAIHPRTASDESSSNGQPLANPNNRFESTFDYGSIHRLLVPQNDADIQAALANNVPDYAQIFMVVNSPYYGGSGGAYATASTDDASTEVAIHEIGHSFAGLADEYWAGDFYAGEKPNMTANSDAATIKWKSWLDLNGIGIYPYGTSGTPASWYRPHENCKMQFLGVPFCSVCSERFIDVFHQKVNMVDVASPTAGSFTLTNKNPVAFAITQVETEPSSIGIRWYLNGSATPFAVNQYAVTVPYASFNTGNNTIKAEVVDSTSLSKSYLPAVGYVNTITWTVNNPIVLPVQLLSFSGKAVNKSALLNWEVDMPETVQAFEIEKSKNGTRFTRLATVPAKAAQKNYSYTDEDLSAPYSFYRINLIEKGGGSHHSNILRLQNNFDKFFYKVYQDAASHKYHLSVGITDVGRLNVNITDLQGKLVLRKDFGNLQSQLDYDFDLSNQPAGMYFMTLRFKDNSYTVQLAAQ